MGIDFSNIGQYQRLFRDLRNAQGQTPPELRLAEALVNEAASPQGKGDRGDKIDLDKLFAGLDTTHDGVLSQDEIRAFMQKHPEELGDDFDINLAMQTLQPDTRGGIAKEQVRAALEKGIVQTHLSPTDQDRNDYADYQEGLNFVKEHEATIEQWATKTNAPVNCLKSIFAAEYARSSTDILSFIANSVDGTLCTASIGAGQTQLRNANKVLHPDNPSPSSRDYFTLAWDLHWHPEQSIKASALILKENKKEIDRKLRQEEWQVGPDFQTDYDQKTMSTADYEMMLTASYNLGTSALRTDSKTNPAIKGGITRLSNMSRFNYITRLTMREQLLSPEERTFLGVPEVTERDRQLAENWMAYCNQETAMLKTPG